MKITIVESHEDEGKMTIEELAKEEFVGLVVDGKKYMLTGYSDNRMFGRAGSAWDYEKTVKELLDTCNRPNCTFYIFKTDKELYKWMSE